MKNKKVFLYGVKNIGKSTMIDLFIKMNGLNARGFKTKMVPDYEKGISSLHLLSYDLHEECNKENMAAQKFSDGWKVRADVFERVGTKLITFTKIPDIIVLDELGFLEKDAVEFQRKVLKLLDGRNNVLGAIKPSFDTEFLNRIKSHPEVKLIEVTGANRDMAVETLCNIFFGNSL